jgi:hypothetical protein
LRRHPGLEAAEQLAGRDHIQAAPQVREELQHGQVRVRLHGEADEVRDRGKGLVEDLEMPGQRRVTIDVGRRADLEGDPVDRDLLAVQVVAAVVEVVHTVLPLQKARRQGAGPWGS